MNSKDSDEIAWANLLFFTRFWRHHILSNNFSEKTKSELDSKLLMKDLSEVNLLNALIIILEWIMFNI